ncbi:Uncharacterized conserved protein YciI, contains a putative active-site phosphohistidine [Cohnella sp. OV330]|uniref:YciI family protein n=1 Tax=Cohnella sp. OV330 TaxID=1855288 RepID=UPI0008F2F4C9|nr:Uncharacterized conserved protein YciI, contains a putative active-site phosphohistidine [Cohnella sp. OV330]
MSDFVVLLKTLDADKVDAHRETHIAFLEALRAEGSVVANGRLADGSGGLVIYRGESEAQIRALVENDPFVVSGARSYEIREWLVKWGPAAASLAEPAGETYRRAPSEEGRDAGDHDVQRERP